MTSPPSRSSRTALVVAKVASDSRLLVLSVFASSFLVLLLSLWAVDLTSGVSSALSKQSAAADARQTKMKPYITYAGWGDLIVEDKHQKDVIAYGWRHEPWDWKKDGTNHNNPGMPKSAVTAWLNRYPSIKTVVLSRSVVVYFSFFSRRQQFFFLFFPTMVSGVDGKLQLAFDSKELATDREIRIIEARTPKAIEVYNNYLRDSRFTPGDPPTILGFFHSTC